MSEYSMNIIQMENGYFLKNYSTVKICIRYIMLILLSFLVFISVGSIIFYIKDKEIRRAIFLTIVTMAIYIPFFLGINDVKKIIFDNKSNKVIFKYRLIPFLKIIKIDFDMIETVSINYIQDTAPFFHQVKEKTYCVDIIDKNRYSYTLFQSTAYNEDLINFAIRISKIINKEVYDKNTVEGYKNIYEKNII
jgi:hypothetical protein